MLGGGQGRSVRPVRVGEGHDVTDAFKTIGVQLTIAVTVS